VNEQRLQLPDGTPVNAFVCGVCGLIYTESEPGVSARCCRCAECGATLDPKVLGHRSFACKECSVKISIRRDEQRLQRAEEIVGYSGPVCIDDRFWSSVEEMVDDIESDDDAALPDFVHTCHVRHYTLDADDIVENMLENTSLEEPPDLDGMQEFRQACAAFNKANESNTYWEEDSKHKVRVPVAPSRAAGQEGQRR
jgi:hypothetical protein